MDELAKEQTYIEPSFLCANELINENKNMIKAVV